jgi:hypothetical protein
LIVPPLCRISINSLSLPDNIFLYYFSAKVSNVLLDVLTQRGHCLHHHGPLKPSPQ